MARLLGSLLFCDEGMVGWGNQYQIEVKVALQSNT